jgi:SAM-dependent methyltransferase
MQMDLKTPAATIVDTITNHGIPLPIGQVDAVVMNLALHYILTDDKALANIVKLVQKLLKSGGVFIFTTFDGQRIFKLLEKMNKGQSWDIMDPDGKTLRYSLRKNYKDAKFKTGLTIGAVHPFSRGQYYDEPLVDIDAVVSAFEATDFKLMQKGSFADWHEKFKKFDNHWFNQLSADDKKYGMLYTYVSLRKK